MASQSSRSRVRRLEKQTRLEKQMDSLTYGDLRSLKGDHECEQTSRSNALSQFANLVHRQSSLKYDDGDWFSRELYEQQQRHSQTSNSELGAGDRGCDHECEPEQHQTSHSNALSEFANQVHRQSPFTYGDGDWLSPEPQKTTYEYQHVQPQRHSQTSDSDDHKPVVILPLIFKYYDGASYAAYRNQPRNIYPGEQEYEHQASLYKLDDPMCGEKIKQDILKMDLSIKAKRVAALKKYYDVLTATEGFFLGDLDEINRHVPTGVSRYRNENLEVISCAKFALGKLNKEEGMKLEFMRVVGVNGLNKDDIVYWMTIEASDKKFYEAKVHDHTPFAGLELCFIRPAVHYPQRSGNARSLRGASTCSETDFAPLAPLDYGLSIQQDDDEDMLEYGNKRYIDVLGETEGFYVGDLSKLALFPLVGGKHSMNTDNPDAVESARFALECLNAQQGTELEFTRLVGVNGQMVSGYWFWMTIEASDGMFYEAKVFETMKGEKRSLEFIRLAVHYPSKTLYFHDIY